MNANGLVMFEDGKSGELLPNDMTMFCRDGKSSNKEATQQSLIARGAQNDFFHIVKRRK